MAENELQNKYGNFSNFFENELGNLNTGLDKLENRLLVLESHKGRASPQLEYLNLLYQNISGI